MGAIAVLGLPLVPINAGFPIGMTFGNILIILSSLAWVAGAIFSKELLKKYSTLTMTFLIFAIGCLVFLIPTINEYLSDPNWISKVSFLGIFALFYITIASSIAAYFLFQWGMDQVGVAKADLFQYLEPLIAITLGVLILGDQLRFSFIIGAILIILGVYWSTVGKNNFKHPKYHRH
jgi:drug/metabolite transporter (DMT)-like permease